MSKNQVHKRRPNYLYVIISVALVLFLLGFFGLMLLYTQDFISLVKERVNVMVELKTPTEQSIIEQLEHDIEQSDYVKPGSTHFTTKEEGAKLLQKDLGSDFPVAELSNMLYDAIFFNVKANFVHRDSLSKIRRFLVQNEAVNDVYYEEGTVGDITENLRNAAIFILVLSLFFILATITLIHNTIRLALYSNRFVIKNMELVGASWGFITRPYMWRSFWQGVISAVIASAFLIFVFFYIRSQMGDFQGILNPAWLSILIIALLILGVSITTLSTYYVVNKYLRLRIDDLY